MKDHDSRFDYPSELEFLEFFGVEPEKDGDWVYYYDVMDGDSVRLRFSFDVIEGSVQTALYLGQQRVMVVSQEGVRRIWIETIHGDTALRAEIARDGLDISLTLSISPHILVLWSGLEVHS